MKLRGGQSREFGQGKHMRAWASYLRRRSGGYKCTRHWAGDLSGWRGRSGGDSTCPEVDHSVPFWL